MAELPPTEFFWTVATEGSLVRAAEKLRVSQPSNSEQIRELESALGKKFSSAKAGTTD